MFSSCVGRPVIDAAIWKNNTPLPAIVCNDPAPQFCIAYPAECEQLKQVRLHGFYRKLNNGQLQFTSFCSPDAVRWLAMRDDDYNKIMDQAFPKGK